MVFLYESKAVRGFTHLPSQHTHPPTHTHTHTHAHTHKNTHTHTPTHTHTHTHTPTPPPTHTHTQIFSLLHFHSNTRMNDEIHRHCLSSDITTIFVEVFFYATPDTFRNFWFIIRAFVAFLARLFSTLPYGMQQHWLMWCQLAVAAVVLCPCVWINRGQSVWLHEARQIEDPRKVVSISQFVSDIFLLLNKRNYSKTQL